MGYRDPNADIVRVRKHLVAICDALRKKGKRVCLATAASPTPLTTGESDTAPLNVALEEFCKRCGRVLADPSQAGVLRVQKWGERTLTEPLTRRVCPLSSSTSTDELPVVLGPRLDTYAFRRDTSLAFDSYHFNSSVSGRVVPSSSSGSCGDGSDQCVVFATLLALVPQAYRLLARNAADFLVPMMTAVEWATWKHQLNKVTYDKALYD